MAFGLEAAPLLLKGWISAQLARIAVIAIGPLAINALTWSGYFWALWPIGGCDPAGPAPHGVGTETHRQAGALAFGLILVPAGGQAADEVGTDQDGGDDHRQHD